MQNHPMIVTRPCKFCGNTFTDFRRQPFCSAQCSFWNKVEKTPDCWLWKACTNNGYGVFRYHDFLFNAARLSWEIANGAIPNGLEVCHNCPGGDNPRCVNPAHLFLGSHAENCHDMAAKGRASRGSHRPLAKMTEADVIAARFLHSHRLMGVSELARLFGVCHATMGLALRRERWKHIP